jgi:UDP-N-acetylglucosamine 4,6-dehydratase
MNKQNILITGGTGSLGKKLVETIFDKFIPNKVIVFSRDEYKQSEMQKTYDYDKIRYFIGDVRDKERLKLALRDVDIVIHAAALKQVPAMEYNPTEAVKTNIYGTQNVIEACIDCGVKKAIFISTDKAVNPINLYGATKMAAEKLWQAANSYAVTKFSSVRYGNVIGSRGSVIPYFLKLKNDGATTLPITDMDMTRFFITLDEAANLVIAAYAYNELGTFVPVMKSMEMRNLARTIIPDCELRVVGIRPGEKIHESINVDGQYVYAVEMNQSEFVVFRTDVGISSKNSEKYTQKEMRCLIDNVDTNG